MCVLRQPITGADAGKFIAVCIIVNMKFKAETMIITRKNLFIKEPTALMPYERGDLL